MTTVTVCFYTQFMASKVGVNGLTVTWDVDRIERSTGTRVALFTGEATNITVGRRGLYGFRLENADIRTYDYLVTAITADASVDSQEIPTLWTLYSLSLALAIGFIEFTYTVTDPLANPVEGAEVVVSTDNTFPPSNVVWKGTTDTFGVARDINDEKPKLDAGTYYFWVRKGGYSVGDWPDVEVVS